MIVSIICLTYNHGRYIRNAIDGFLNQKTSFEFEIVICDDHSTDCSSEIVKEYIATHPYGYRIKYFRQTRNVGVLANGLFSVDKCTGKYIALCEGDDYWIDAAKLQKQVDFLENNISYTICWTHYKVLHETKEGYETNIPDWVVPAMGARELDIDLNNIFTPYCTYSLTALFPKKHFDVKFIKSLKYFKDNTIYAMCLTNGPGRLLDFYSGIYRVHESGTYSGLSEFNQKYKSYLNLKEIVQKIPKCNNRHLRRIRNILLADAIRLSPPGSVFTRPGLFYSGLRYLDFKTFSMAFSKKQGK